MTIQEVVKDGRNFRRAGWDSAYVIIGTNRTAFLNLLRFENSDELVALTPEDVISNDWEIKP